MGDMSKTSTHTLNSNEKSLNLPITPGQQVNKDTFVRNWMMSADFNSELSETSSQTSSASAVDSETLNDLGNIHIGTNNNSSNIIQAHSNISKNHNNLVQEVFNSNNNIQSLGNISINDSKSVHIGNIIHISGSIHITENTKEKKEIEKNITKRKQSDLENPTKFNERESDGPEHNYVCKSTPLGEDDEVEEINRNDLFIGNIARSIEGNVLRIVDRRTWLAQKPLEDYELITGPVPYVIISHTATELATTQADNVYLVRNIQCFHIESRRWNDIAYNFLIGGDGNVYEGRGWGIVGAHTHGFNKRAMGISFVGCFMKELPPSISLDACRLLIKRGIELGHIHPEYKLLAHCQCSATESPGRTLFEELKTWSHFSAQS